MEIRVEERKSIRERISIKSHSDLTPYMLQCRHMSCVHAAAQLGCLECLKWMIEHIGLHPNEADSRYGATPLHYAASAGHHKIIKFLLPRVQQIQADYDGASPLHDAAVNGHYVCLQELLKSSMADPTATDNYGLTPAEWAEQAQEKRCAKLLRDNMKKSSLTKKGRIGNKANGDDKGPEIKYEMKNLYSDDGSDTYAQIEPVACECDNTPPQLPPRTTPLPKPTEKLHQSPKNSKYTAVNLHRTDSALSQTSSNDHDTYQPHSSLDGYKRDCSIEHLTATYATAGVPSPRHQTTQIEIGGGRQEEVPLFSPPPPLHSFSTFCPTGPSTIKKSYPHTQHAGIDPQNEQTIYSYSSQSSPQYHLQHTSPQHPNFTSFGYPSHAKEINYDEYHQSKNLGNIDVYSSPNKRWVLMATGNTLKAVEIPDIPYS